MDQTPESAGQARFGILQVAIASALAALVKKAEDWPWSRAYSRLYGNAKQKKILSPWPVTGPSDYRLNHSQGREEIESIRYAIKRSRPYGSEKRVSKAVGRFALKNTMRNRGRPKKGT
jgi:hypothetical protein